jgi:hypothetical protein
MMARVKASGKEQSGGIEVVRHLMVAAENDTVFRDLYLQRAALRLEPLFSRAQYDRQKTQPAQLEQLTQETRRAVAQQDWNRVQELAAEVSALKGPSSISRADLELADKVYGGSEVAIDPFSWVLDALLGRSGQSKTALRDQLVSALGALEKEEQEWVELFASRRSYFAKLQLAEGQQAGAAAGKDDVGRLQQRAAEAAERGDADTLKRIAQEMLKARPAKTDDAPAAERKAISAPRPTYSPELGQPFPDATVERAGKFGLAHLRLTLKYPELSQHAAETFSRYGWHPSFPAQEVARNGEAFLRPLIERAAVPKELVDPFLEAAMLFALHPFVNSGGVRYLPLFPDVEFALIEDFPEDAVPAEPSELLKALGLGRRAGVSRLEIDMRLREQGANIVRERLGLDPTKFRLICIPYDLYTRLGQERKWGQQPRWTHVDGYQLLKGSRMRALVAGDVRYGGLFDLCSISQIDERESVLSRFAVIHRERLMVR